MPSAPRDLAPGLHHVWVGATGHESYFTDSEDRITWVRELVSTVRLFEWECLAFCEMTTHVHLIVEVRDDSLPLGMKRLNLRYSRDFNDRHDRRGQFIRRRYGSRRILDGKDLIGVYAYVILNPVIGGACSDPTDWGWSSYRTTLGIAHDFPFVDASRVVGEAGGTVERLRQVVDSVAAKRLSEQARSGVRHQTWPFRP